MTLAASLKTGHEKRIESSVYRFWDHPDIVRELNKNFLNIKVIPTRSYILMCDGEQVGMYHDPHFATTPTSIPPLEYFTGYKVVELFKNRGILEYNENATHLFLWDIFSSGTFVNPVTFEPEATYGICSLGVNIFKLCDIPL